MRGDSRGSQDSRKPAGWRVLESGGTLDAPRARALRDAPRVVDVVEPRRDQALHYRAVHDLPAPCRDPRAPNKWCSPPRRPRSRGPLSEVHYSPFSLGRVTGARRQSISGAQISGEFVEPRRGPLIGEDDQGEGRQPDLLVDARARAPVPAAPLRARIGAELPTIPVASVYDDVNLGSEPGAKVVRQGETVSRDDKETSHVTVERSIVRLDGAAGRDNWLNTAIGRQESPPKGIPRCGRSWERVGRPLDRLSISGRERRSRGYGAKGSSTRLSLVVTRIRRSTEADPARAAVPW